MKVFITGGAGFIGRELVKQCLEMGYEVVVYDNFSVAPRSNLYEFEGKVTIIEADILDEERLYSSLFFYKPEYVFHLAAIHFIPFCNANPTKAFQINLQGTICIAECVSKFDFIKCLVFSSTGAVYDDSNKPLNENDVPKPIDVYGISKLQAEEILIFYSKYKFNGTYLRIARLFNNVGLFETNEHLFPHIVNELKRNHDTVSLGNIKTQRDYISTYDTAKGLLAIANNSNEKYDIINLGTGIEYSAEVIVDIFSKKLGRPISIYCDASRIRQNDKMHQIADISKASLKYSWMPTIEIDTLIYELIKDAKIE